MDNESSTEQDLYNQNVAAVLGGINKSLIDIDSRLAALEEVSKLLPVTIAEVASQTVQKRIWQVQANLQNSGIQAQGIVSKIVWTDPQRPRIADNVKYLFIITDRDKKEHRMTLELHSSKCDMVIAEGDIIHFLVTWFTPIHGQGLWDLPLITQIKIKDFDTE